MSVFSSLRVPNYRQYFFGILTSNTGTWMARTAQAWLVLVVLTQHDAQALGVVTGLQFLPILLLSAFGGALADRFPKRVLMVCTQSAMALNAVLLGVLVTSGHVQLWHVFLCALIDGTAAAIDNPARQSFVSEIVPTEQLSNAIGLNSASFNAARLVGPGLAGVLIALWGTGPVFWVNAVTFAAVILALATMRSDQLSPAPRAARGTGGVREGLRYVRARPYLLLIMVVAAMVGLFGMNYQLTNVMMSTMVFGRGAVEYGMLGSVMAIGSLTAALLAARRQRPRLRLLMGALAVFVVCTLLSAVAPNFWVFTLLLIPSGLSVITVMITCNSLLQLTSDATYRGRVMALYMLVFMGTTPIGAPALGWVGQHLGARWTLGIGGIALALTWIVIAIYLARAEDLHVRLDLRHRPFVVLHRGRVTEDAGEKFA
ncbi:MFS transporter [Naumannella sp. ID2617S]|nr:MFS transporter [Naumannella sp. ID2617S]